MPAFEHQQSPARSGAPVRAAKVGRGVPRPVHANDPLLAGQQALGNQAVQRLLLTGALQTKLRVGRPDDSYEQEADRVAGTVMRMPEPEVRRQETEVGEEEEEDLRAEPIAEEITPLVQRQTEAPPEEEEEPPQAETAAGEVQRQEAEPAEEEEEEPQGVQRKAKGTGITHVREAALVQRLRSPDGGAPLPGGVRSFFERRFAYDFSEVRVHDTYRDQADAASLGARAFTYGKNIWLGHGESVSDSRLIAHELTHVVQQDAGVRRRRLAVSPVAPRVQRSWWDRVKETVGGAISSVGELVGDAKAAVLGKLAQWAKRIPGFDLLTVILGRDPISDQPVERDATNLIKGVLGLLGPPGLAMFENLQRAGAIDRAFEWFDQEIAKLNLTWEAIKALFRTAWASLSLSDVLNLSNAVTKVAQIFGPSLARLVNFASAAGRKILEFIFEGALSLAGGDFGTRVLAIVRRAGAVFSTIINDPIKFIGNLVAAVRGGFERFSDNILDHLRTALMQWLFGALSGAGLTLPDRFDLRGIVSIVLQVLGLTYDRLRAKLVGLIGEKNVARIEGVFDFLKTIGTGGLAAAWKQIVGYVENLQEMVIGGIREWVANSIVGAAIKKLVTMFNPAGAVIQAIMAVYNTVVFFIERAQQIAALAEAVFDSISNIAAGNIGAAISYVERTMVRALPVIIGFLARLIGLGNIGDRIKDIIKKIQAPIERAIDKLATFVMQRAKRLLAAGTGDLTPQQRLEQALLAAQAAVNKFAGRRVGALVLRPLLGVIQLRYRLTSLEVIPESGHWSVIGVVNPSQKRGTSVLVGQPEEEPRVVPGMEITFPEAPGTEAQKSGRIARTVLSGGRWWIEYRIHGSRESVPPVRRLAYKTDGTLAYRLPQPTAEDIKVDQGAPSGSRHPTGYVDFRPLRWTDYDRPGGGEPVGWPRLTKAARWVRGHLVNGRWGGPGGRLGTWNLVCIPEYVNRQMSDNHEGALHPKVRAGHPDIWLRIDVTYHSNEPGAEIGLASDFPKTIHAQYWVAQRQGDNWVKGSSLGSSTYGDIPLPRSTDDPSTNEIEPNRKSG